MKEDLFLIKGIKEGILVTFQENTWKEAVVQFLQKIDETPEFFKGGHIAIDVGSQILKSRELGRFRNQLSERDINLWAVLSESSVTIQTALILGLSTEIVEKKKKIEPSKKADSPEAEEAVWIERTLRAGYRVETKFHVVVVGDVNPGAEIVSDGNILVWGRLQGSVHAGVSGNSNAKVMAKELNPTSLQIANIIGSPIQKKRKTIPEIAYIQNDKIVIEAWEKTILH